VNLRLKPGAIRELHRHKAAEWAYMLAGRARVTCIDPEGRNFLDVGADGHTPAFLLTAATHRCPEVGVNLTDARLGQAWARKGNLP
jgi:oxalate decarboxylase/phosphoglucose isomerase-like protein (cupin superfamily)